tara:strand:- start:58 stop:627 length:570 start_codon:yes stop_codon:yes gene_type:complete
MKKKIIKVFLILFFFILLLFLYSKFFQNKTEVKVLKTSQEDISSTSNIIEGVKYMSKDVSGNEYMITASQGEIDYSNTNIIYLTDVKGLISFNDSTYIKISSDYGKYNISNFDTVFSKNVLIDYPNNKITSEYLDFSIKNKLMLISRNVIYKNLNNTLNADVIEINLETKDTKIFMYENNKSINIKSKN